MTFSFLFSSFCLIARTLVLDIGNAVIIFAIGLLLIKKIFKRKFCMELLQFEEKLCLYGIYVMFTLKSLYLTHCYLEHLNIKTKPVYLQLSTSFLHKFKEDRRLY